jgi:type IV secretory pathway ATPase VirB11/archaellum biosynthesis ATPase
MPDLLARFGLGDTEEPCACETTFEGDRLVVRGDGCPGDADLAASPACRATAISALRERDADAVLGRCRGVDRRYASRAVALLVAAGRFARRIADRAERLAARTETDPLAAAREASGRAGPVADVAAETGFLEAADAPDYEAALRAFVGPTLARSRIDPTPPADGRLEHTVDDSGSRARLYAVPGSELRTYHLAPTETTLSAAEMATLDRAHDRLAAGVAGDGERASVRAVRAVTDGEHRKLVDVLRKHTRGYGVLEDFFADPAVTDVLAPAPAVDSDIRIRRDGETLRTNVRLTAGGAAALASRLRRASGRAFSRASPTLDAVVENVGAAERVRAAGVTRPATDGTGFAFRAHGGTSRTLPALLANGTVSGAAAALLSVAVERATAALLAGTRGAGKTTLLGALLWELPAATRLVTIEDTPELPVEALAARGRDVQPLYTDDAERGLAPSAALRTALRLGEGALAVGEVRGEEAGVLYEAMQVGAHGSAVLGTIHGDGGDAVRERVAELGVPESSFAATDLVVTLTREGEKRRVVAIEEVLDDGSLATLYGLDDGQLAPTGRVERGNSACVASLAEPGESYGDVLESLDARESFLVDLVAEGRTDADAVASENERRRGEQ